LFSAKEAKPYNQINTHAKTILTYFNSLKPQLFFERNFEDFV